MCLPLSSHLWYNHVLYIFTVLHQNHCDQRCSHDGEHQRCGDSSVRVGTAVEGLVVNIYDDGERSCKGLLTGRLDLLLW